MGDIANEIMQLIYSGVKVQVNGYDIETEDDLEKNMIKEEDCCMRDYIWNEKGEYIQVNFDVIHVE